MKFCNKQILGVQSNTLGKPISTALIIFFSSNDFFHSSISFKRTVFPVDASVFSL